MVTNSPSESFKERAFYSAHFMDADYWLPFVRLACERHGMSLQEVHPGLPGTFPTFICQMRGGNSHQADKRMVVKFFGPLFGGAASFQVEREIGAWLNGVTLPLKSPRVLADGDLDEEWSFLFFEFVPGGSIGLVRTQLSTLTWEAVARQVGEYMRLLHRLNPPRQVLVALEHESSRLAQTWQGYSQFLQQQSEGCQERHICWNDLPAHLSGQVQEYLLPVEDLIDPASPPHLVHGDLTGDHLLGKLVQQDGSLLEDQTAGWQSLAIIDWGDARIGNILYELLPVYIDLFHMDRRLFDICLEVYGLPAYYRHDFARKMMSLMLLQLYPIPKWLVAPHTAASSLEELAARLFGG